MPVPAFVRFFEKDTLIPGPDRTCGEDNLWTVLEFSHRLGNGHYEFIGLTGQWKECDLVEIPDLLFNLNSAVPVLDEAGDMIGSATAALAFVHDTPGKEVVVFGHADTSGEIAPNYDLAQLRADAVKALLDDDRDAFKDAVLERSTVTDYQQVLKSLTIAHGWSCDPGTVDGMDGPGTQAGVRAFQDEYNTRFDESIAVDGAIGPQTWGAIFDVMRSLVQEAFAQRTGAREMPSLTYGCGGTGVFSCGESFPVEQAHRDEYRSSENRRVEVVFFEKGETPTLTEPADRNKLLTGAECPVYGNRVIRRMLPVQVTPAEEEFTVSCVIDSHMHIQSGTTAPLPLLRKQKGLLRTPILDDRSEMEGPFARAVMNQALGGLGDLQSLSSDAIAKCALRRNNATFSSDSAIGRDRIYTGEIMPHESHPADASSTTSPPPGPEKKVLYTPMIVLTMDMEYAHLAGFEGKTIYHTDERGNKFYYKRRDAFHREEDGTRENFEESEKDRFQDWKRQVSETKEAVKNNPWDLLPLYHYEPRRWNYPRYHELGEKLARGPWDFPFTEVASGMKPGRGGVFLGFKMYPSLGYMPLDRRCAYLGNFYDKCVAEDVPVMTHCSPGGMTTHEDKYYVDADGMRRVESSDSPHSSADATSVVTEQDPYEYFELNYGHPQGWREVLRGRDKLRLCLAHFGGDLWQEGPDHSWIQEIIHLIRDYPNVYTDVSCWNIVQNGPAFKEFLLDPAYNDVKRKILFGTDWYLTLTTMWGKKYREFCEEIKEFLDRIDRRLWVRFTLVNPFEFYDLGNEVRLGNVMEGIRGLGLDDCQHQRAKAQYDRIRSIRSEWDHVKTQ